MTALQKMTSGETDEDAAFYAAIEALETAERELQGVISALYAALGASRRAQTAERGLRR